MWGKGITLFKLFGFKVRADLSWLVLAVLVTWSLASGVFPAAYPDLQPVTYWLMGVAGAIGLFISIVFHEFWHSLIARRFGLPMKGITLFIFGGVAEMSEQPASPSVEFFMAIAGPISSVVLGGALYLLSRAMPQSIAGSVLRWLGVINFILAGFNMIPAFPLDGGRVLRAILWAAKKDLRGATLTASRFGSGFGIFLIIWGVVHFIGGYFISGLWLALIGMFIRGASRMSYQQVVLRQSLQGRHVDRFMRSDPVTVPASTTVRDLVENYFYRYHHRMFPVTNGSGLAGCVTSRQVKDLPQERWDTMTVSQVLQPCSPDNTIRSDADADKALALMNRTGNSRLLVVDGDSLVGIITLKDMLDFLAMKFELEE